MMKQHDFWFFAFVFFAISLFATSCDKDAPLLDPLNEEIEIEDEVLEEIITPIDLNVTVKNGALVFENGDDLFHARDVLRTVNLASRLAWEESIGFKSIRGIYEGILKDFNDEKPLDTDSYSSIIDFSEHMPLLKNHGFFTSSILNLDQIVYVGDAIGTIRTDGSFWVMDGDIDKLNKLIQNPEEETDIENGLIAVTKQLKKDNNELKFRSCTSLLNDEYLDQQTVNNGTDRGATELRGEFRFESVYAPLNPPTNTIGNYTAEAYMLGRSFRRKRCRCGWKPYPDDHIFTWNIEIGQNQGSNPNVYTTYSGTDTHVNNELAVKFMFSQIHNNITSQWALDNYYFLNEINSVTNQTTDNLDLPGIFYSCN